MTDTLDLADLRLRVTRTPSDDDDLQAVPKPIMLALIERAETLEAVRAEALKMHAEHGQSWNSISGARILRAMGITPPDYSPEPGSDTVDPDWGA